MRAENPGLISRMPEDDSGGEGASPAESTGRVRMPTLEIMRAALDVSQDAVCFVDVDTSRITYANPAAEGLFGYRGDDWATIGLGELVQERGEYDPRPGEAFVSTRVRHRDGHLIRGEWNLFGFAPGNTAVAVFRPLLEAASISDTERDPLTGLPNRRVFERRLSKSLEQKHRDFAVLFLDLDDFKQVNDRFGHTLGDRVLRLVAERLVHGLRPIDTVARYGGDEFVVLLDGIEDRSSATKAVRRLLRAIAAPIEVEEHSLRIGASVGIVLSGHMHMDLEEIIRAADRAMYRAKTLGPGRYAVFDD